MSPVFNQQTTGKIRKEIDELDSEGIWLMCVIYFSCAG
jgi:hypothetical protein